MLKIRLQRIGKRGQAHFKLVVTEHTKKPKGKYLELLGSYDPHRNAVSVDGEKVKYWLGQGAQLSETVNNLLVGRGVIEGDKVKVWKPKKKIAAGSDAGQTSAPNQQAGGKEQKEKPKAEKSKEEKVEESVPEMPKEEVKDEKSASVSVEAPVTG